jgi:hypothetical protein
MKTNTVTLRWVAIGGVCLMLMLACGLAGSPTAIPTIPPTVPLELTATSIPTPTPLPATMEPALPQEDNLVFRDDFEGTMDEGWQWTRENKNTWSLSKEPGWLEIMAGAGHVGDDSVENLLLRPAPEGNFELETRLKFQPSANFQIAGLLIFESGANFIQFGRAFCDVPAPTCAGDGFYVDMVTGGDANPENFSVAAPATDTVLLRLRREGSTFTAYTSEDGTEWKLIGTHNGEIVPLFVGMVSGQSTSRPIPAQFDTFMIRELPASAETTVSTPEPSCYRWDEITLDMAGEVVCVYGVAYSHQGQSRIDFSPVKNSFFLIDTVYYYPNLTEGSCVVAEEKVEIFDNKIPYMTIHGKLYKCEPWMME